MKLSFAVFLLSFSAMASECKGTLYEDYLPDNSSQCKRITSRKFCCPDEGPKRCYLRIVCMDGGRNRGPFCGPQKICEY